MGIINVTPDSFFDGGHFATVNAAIAHGKNLIREGACILDIGGESTRPGASPVPVDDEIARVVPVIAGLKNNGAPISIDSRNSKTMAAACAAGATIINDISAFTHDYGSIDVAKQYDADVVLMHMLGTPQTMQQNPTYIDVVDEVYGYLSNRVEYCVRHGIAMKKIIIDPGIGFGKTVEHNLQLLKNIPKLKTIGCRVLIGVSRKSFIGKLSGEDAPERRLSGSLAAAIYAAQYGTDILRVHDVAETRQAFAVWAALANMQI